MIDCLGFGESLAVILENVFENVKNDSTFASRSDRDVQRFEQIKKSLNFICLERKNITIFATPF
jgi:hypothetical protein